ncbi:MAG TPA: NUDIX hydrolase [Bacillota bacterium]|nr:NUDIX hydrolase [Bacillota bacterium]
MGSFKHKLLAVMQHVVIVNQGRVLLLRYSAYQGKGVEGLWGLPGGHYMSGTPEEDLLREVREETGLQLEQEIKLLRTYVVMFPDGIERFGVFYLCDLGNQPEPEVRLSEEHTDYLWLDRDYTEKNITFIGPYHKKVVEDVLNSV